MVEWVPRILKTASKQKQTNLDFAFKLEFIGIQNPFQRYSGTSSQLLLHQVLKIKNTKHLVLKTLQIAKYSTLVNKKIK